MSGSWVTDSLCLMSGAEKIQRESGPRERIGLSDKARHNFPGTQTMWRGVNPSHTVNYFFKGKTRESRNNLSRFLYVLTWQDFSNLLSVSSSVWFGNIFINQMFKSSLFGFFLLKCNIWFWGPPPALHRHENCCPYSLIARIDFQPLVRETEWRELHASGLALPSDG